MDIYCLDEIECIWGIYSLYNGSSSVCRTSEALIAIPRRKRKNDSVVTPSQSNSLFKGEKRHLWCPLIVKASPASVAIRGHCVWMEGLGVWDDWGSRGARGRGARDARLEEVWLDVLGQLEVLCLGRHRNCATFATKNRQHYFHFWLWIVDCS